MLEIFLISYFLTLAFGIWLKTNSKFMQHLINKTREIGLSKGISLEDKSLVVGAHRALVFVMHTPILNYIVFLDYFKFKVSERRLKNESL